ncbi:unnamed protein product, partial [Heterosigma akashiwo]
MADDSNVGKRCNLGDCGRQDYLPFTCDSCLGSFCLAHRAKSDHFCRGGPPRDLDLNRYFSLGEIGRAMFTSIHEGLDPVGVMDTLLSPANENDSLSQSQARGQSVAQVQKNRKRCFTCRKKVGFTGIECRC